MKPTGITSAGGRNGEAFGRLGGTPMLARLLLAVGVVRLERLSHGPYARGGGRKAMPALWESDIGMTRPRTLNLRCMECNRKFPNKQIAPGGIATMSCPDCGTQSLLPDVWEDKPVKAAS